MTSDFLPSTDPGTGQQEIMTDFPSRRAEYPNEEKLGWERKQAKIRIQGSSLELSLLTL